MATVTPGKVFTSNEVVTPANLNALGVPTVDLANSEVTTAKIADANVTTAKIADANVTTAKIANGAVTNSKLGNDIILVPAGAIMPFAMNSAPTGWLPADGAEYDKTGTYAALFAAIGTTHGETNGSGGAGTSHFRVPDLRGYFVRGWGVAGQNGTNLDGTASAAFGVKQADDFKSHSHQILSTSNSAGSPDYAFGAGGAGSLGPTYNTRDTGGTETRPANIALLYCIKF